MYRHTLIQLHRVLPSVPVAVFLAASTIFLSACSDSGGGSAGMQAEPASAESSGTGAENDNKVFADAVDPNEAIPAASAESIADALLENPAYGTLLGLIQKADLASDLTQDNGGIGWTVFAPSDTAFGNHASFESLTALEKNELVKNHVYSGRLTTADLVPGNLSMTAGSVAVEQANDGKLTVGGARIVAGNREFSNGFVHFIDAVFQ